MPVNNDNNLYAKALLFSLLLFIGIFLTQLLTVLFMEYISPGEIESMNSNMSLIHLVLLSWFTLVFCVPLYMLFEYVFERRKPESLTIILFKHSIVHAFAGMVFALVLITLYIGIYLVTESLKIQFQKPEKVYLILLFAMFTAISEELVLRGYLLGIFVRNNKKLTGILISSILFALLHVFNTNINVTAIVTIFLVGLFLGFVTAALKTTYFAIGFHASFNFFILFSGFNNLFKDNSFALLKVEVLDTIKINMTHTIPTGNIILSSLLILLIFVFLIREKIR